MKRPRSFTSLAAALTPSAVIAKTAASFRTVLHTSDGRQEFLALIQYVAELYKECMLPRVYGLDKAEWPISLINAVLIEQSMSQGRKVLRVLKFVDEWIDMRKRWKESKGGWMLAMQMLSHFASLCFFLCDNLVWATSIGLIKDNKLGFKRLKDIASLCRCLLEVLISVHIIRSHFSLISTQRSSFFISPDSLFTHRSPSYESLEKTLVLRNELRYLRLRIAQNILRLCMLVKSLRLPGHVRLSAVFVSVCGIAATALNVFKITVKS